MNPSVPTSAPMAGTGSLLWDTGQSRVLIVVNDNGRSYAPTISRLAAGVACVRASTAYVKSRRRVQHTLREVPVIGEYLDRGMGGVRAALHRVVVTAEGGVRRGGAGSSIQTSLSELVQNTEAAVPPVVALGTPDACVPHGSADALMSELGLDGPALAATALAALGSHHAMGRA